MRLRCENEAAKSVALHTHTCNCTVLFGWQIAQSEIAHSVRIAHDSVEDVELKLSQFQRFRDLCAGSVSGSQICSRL
jgi:hypothetical protein